MAKRDYYEVLEVSKTASVEEIKKFPKKLDRFGENKEKGIPHLLKKFNVKAKYFLLLLIVRIFIMLKEDV